MQRTASPHRGTGRLRRSRVRGPNCHSCASRNPSRFRPAPVGLGAIENSGILFLDSRLRRNNTLGLARRREASCFIRLKYYLLFHSTRQRRLKPREAKVQIERDVERQHSRQGRSGWTPAQGGYGLVVSESLGFGRAGLALGFGWGGCQSGPKITCKRRST